MGAAMIKEGLFTFVHGHGAVMPYRGKYAVKHVDVFDRMHAAWSAAGIPDWWPYRPLRIELELTTKCNDRCPHCGMGALPIAAGRSLDDGQLAYLVDQFEGVALPAIAITGGEPFVAKHRLFRLLDMARGRVDVSKITTNGYWGTEAACARTLNALVEHGLLANRYFVPLLMVSIGEQTTALERVCRILHEVVTRFTDRDLNIAVSSLADPANRRHRIYELKDLYARTYGPFPDDRVHSTMRVYLNNERLPDQAAVRRPGDTTVAQWMGRCFDCFTPTVGAYVNPTALLKYDGSWYTCAAFNVPERLEFGNLYQLPLREILERVNASAYVGRVREGGGLKGLRGVVDQATKAKGCGSYCDACALLIEDFDAQRTTPTGAARLVATAGDLQASLRRLRVVAATAGTVAR